MKTLLVINDNSAEAWRAAEFAMRIAQKLGADILLACNFVKTLLYVEKIRVCGNDAYMHDEPGSTLAEHLNSLNRADTIYKPEIEEIDVSAMNEEQLARVINNGNVWMMVKGMSGAVTLHPEHNINIHTVLNKVLCPLLLIPAHWQAKDIERLAYIADLRYCRLDVVRRLAELARAWSADLSIAHISAKGLPDIEEKYGLELFSEEICKNVNYGQLFFNNIREKDLSKAVDVMIHGLHHDILVMVNHRFHFEELMGRYITDVMPPQVGVPLLVFPS